MLYGNVYTGWNNDVLSKMYRYKCTLKFQNICVNIGGIFVDSIEWRYLITTIMALIGSYTLLLLPMIMIYNIEKTLSPSKLFNNKRIKTELSSLNNSGSDISQMTLKQYLNISIIEYDNFMTYLGDCMAVESLLFYSYIILFRQILVEILQKHYPNIYDSTSFHNECTSIKFEYLSKIKETLKSRINLDILNDETIKSIQEISNNIVATYIETGLEYTINISYECRMELISFHNNALNISIKSDNYYDIISQYITAYDGSLIEMYRLLKSVFIFQYKSNNDH